ncbi:hypothetical protein GGR56DRAFT_196657 [Xylariaceae sp. FL0804]|nr:hypothetical protein GGR56DRAFT_196657 [Xylariaceae sp. FL0804]
MLYSLVPVLAAVLPCLALAAPGGGGGGAPSLLAKRSITCLDVGATATATWTNSDGTTCTWTGVVGSNYGTNAADGDYSCNGRCGAGCTGTAVGDVYTQDCFTHDMCSYWEDATGGASDPNCGDAYDAAVDDTLFGVEAGCSQTNPSYSADPPTGTPVCT